MRDRINLGNVKNKDLVFGRVLKIYWLLFWPVTFLLAYIFHSSLYEENVFVMIIFFLISAAIAGFFIQLFRAIFNEQKLYSYSAKEKRKRFPYYLYLILFVIWSIIFILSFVYKTVIFSFKSFGGEISISWYQEALFFLVAIVGDLVFRLNLNMREKLKEQIR